MENRHRTYQRQSMGLVFFLFVLVLLTLLGRLFYLMIGKADYYGVQAKELHERERKIKAERGEIKDCHGNVLAANRSVSTISVILQGLQVLSARAGRTGQKTSLPVQRLLHFFLYV